MHSPAHQGQQWFFPGHNPGFPLLWKMWVMMKTHQGYLPLQDNLCIQSTQLAQPSATSPVHMLSRSTTCPSFQFFFQFQLKCQASQPAYPDFTIKGSASCEPVLPVLTRHCSLYIFWGLVLECRRVYIFGLGTVCLDSIFFLMLSVFSSHVPWGTKKL